MTRGNFANKIRELLKTDFDLNFLPTFKKEGIETLIAAIRDRVDQVGN